MICVLGLQNQKDTYRQTYEAFHDRITAMEEAVYKANSDMKGNVNEKIHRVQFGFVNADKNWKIRDQLLPKSGVKNPRYIVVISQMNMVYVGNNLGELENIIDDAMHGEFDEFKSLRDVVTADGFEDLLVNESMSLLGYIWYVIKHGFFWSLVLFGIIYWAMKNRIQNHGHALGLSIAVPMSLLMFEIVTKMIAEELL